MASIVFLVLLASFRPPSSPPPPLHHLIGGVPFVPQEREHCGPASLAMVFGYYGIRLSQEELAREVYLKKVSGSLNLDLLIAARRHGFSAQAYSGDLQRLKEFIFRDIPVIALVRSSPDSDACHFLVVIGFDESKGELTVHSGRVPAGRMSYDEFARAWEPSHNWMLVVEQKKDWP